MMARTLIFSSLVFCNIILLFDNIVPPDFEQYQRYWLQGSVPNYPIEFIFNSSGWVFRDIIPDFRFFFVIANCTFFFVLSRYLSVLQAFVFCSSPFAVLGFSNTLLSFTAGLIWLTYFLGANSHSLESYFSKLKRLIIPIFFHKGAIFLSLATQSIFFGLAVAVALLLFGSYVPYLTALRSDVFATSFFEVFMKFLFVYLGFILTSIIGKRPWHLVRTITPPALIVFSAFFITSKLADRVVTILFFHGFALFVRHSMYSFRFNRVMVMHFLIALNLVYIFSTNVKIHVFSENVYLGIDLVKMVAALP